MDYPQGFGPPRIPKSTRGGPHTGLGRPWDTLTVKEKPDATLASIEETQTALRASIEAAKQLAEKSDFLLSSDQWRQTTYTRNIQSALNPTFLEYPIDNYWLGDSSQVVFTQCLTIKIPLNEPVGIRANHHGIRFGKPL